MPRRSVVARALASLGVAAVTLAAPCASAFCRTTTVSTPAGYQPADEGCWTQGNVLYWKNACVGYDLQQNASKQVSLDDAEQAIASAFAKWTGSVCPTGGDSPARVSIDVRDLGPVACDLVQYNQDQPNQHVILFQDAAWPHNDSANTLALTTVTYDPDTGEIYDADMEINSHSETLTVTGPVPADGYDFESIVTHETGHFLGLAHATDERATMFSTYAQGETAMRNLTADDISGICAIYPPNGTRTTSVGEAVPEDTCDPTPRHGFSTQCAGPDSKACISLDVGGRAPSGPGAVGVLGLIAVSLLGRRYRLWGSRKPHGSRPMQRLRTS